MQPLMLHPDCSPGPVEAVTASIEPTDSGCRARFALRGDIGAIKLPAHAHPARTDDLWKTTCFEIFWQPEGRAAYREFNLSPSSRWAAYDFDEFRENSRDAPVGAISIACSSAGGRLELEASITSDLPLPAKVALNAIVEDRAGNLHYWALVFAPGKPEFHSEVCRAIILEGPR